MVKNAALSGNTSMGETNIVQEIEDNIQKLRDDLDDLKKSSVSDFNVIRNDLHNKFTKEDAKVLEQRL